MTPFVRKIKEYAKEGSIVQVLCQYPTCYREYKKALNDATIEELKTALLILREFPKINGPSRKLIEQRLSQPK